MEVVTKSRDEMKVDHQEILEAIGSLEEMVANLVNELNYADLDDSEKGLDYLHALVQTEKALSTVSWIMPHPLEF